jgi:hypothetical protein
VFKIQRVKRDKSQRSLGSHHRQIRDEEEKTILLKDNIIISQKLKKSTKKFELREMLSILFFNDPIFSDVFKYLYLKDYNLSCFMRMILNSRCSLTFNEISLLGNLKQIPFINVVNILKYNATKDIFLHAFEDGRHEIFNIKAGSEGVYYKVNLNSGECTRNIRKTSLVMSKPVVNKVNKNLMIHCELPSFENSKVIFKDVNDMKSLRPIPFLGEEPVSMVQVVDKLKDILDVPSTFDTQFLGPVKRYKLPFKKYHKYCYLTARLCNNFLMYRYIHNFHVNVNPNDYQIANFIIWCRTKKLIMKLPQIKITKPLPMLKNTNCNSVRLTPFSVFFDTNTYEKVDNKWQELLKDKITESTRTFEVVTNVPVKNQSKRAKLLENWIYEADAKLRKYTDSRIDKVFSKRKFFFHPIAKVDIFEWFDEGILDKGNNIYTDELLAERRTAFDQRLNSLKNSRLEWVEELKDLQKPKFKKVKEVKTEIIKEVTKEKVEERIDCSKEWKTFHKKHSKIIKGIKTSSLCVVNNLISKAQITLADNIYNNLIVENDCEISFEKSKKKNRKSKSFFDTQIKAKSKLDQRLVNVEMKRLKVKTSLKKKFRTMLESKLPKPIFHLDKKENFDKNKLAYWRSRSLTLNKAKKLIDDNNKFYSVENFIRGDVFLKVLEDAGDDLTGWSSYKPETIDYLKQRLMKEKELVDTEFKKQLSLQVIKIQKKSKGLKTYKSSYAYKTQSPLKWDWDLVLQALREELMYDLNEYLPKPNIKPGMIKQYLTKKEMNCSLRLRRLFLKKMKDSYLIS